MNTPRERLDKLVRHSIQLSGWLAIVVLLGIFLMLCYNSLMFWRSVGIQEFLGGYLWQPSTASPRYGIVPLLASTFWVSAGAMAIAIPLGIGTAAYLSEFAPVRIKHLLKPAIELLAAIPSVTIGFLGIVVVGPSLSYVLAIPNGINALNGAILLAVMSLPTIITISEDAISAVPQSYREASTALGATPWATLYRVTLPAAAPGLIAAIMLGLGRAIGETMTVLMATGNATAMPNGLLDSVRTLTASIAIEMGEVPYQSTHYFALFALGFVLFLGSLMINLVGEYFAQRARRFHE